MNLLALALLLPLAGFLLVLLLPKAVARQVCLGISLATLGAAAVLTLPFFGQPQGAYRHGIDIPWITAPAIRLHFAVDGLSVWLVLLSALLVPLAALLSWNSIQRREKEFFAFLLLLEFALVGVFSALDLFLFYVFYELTLVPSIFMIGIWGGERRHYAAIKFFLYTLAASVLMLAGILFLYSRTGTMQLPEILAALDSGRVALPRDTQMPLFLGFFVAFGVKFALFPLHTWLPDAYDEAPAATTMLLAGVLTKMGTYGLVRFCLPLFPSAAQEAAGWISVLAVIGILYGALVALVQPNMKRLIAYSSISHIGFITLGVFSFQQTGLDGASYQMLAHGISTGALFLLLGMLEQRRKSMEIVDYSGLANVTPRYATVFLITTLASIGLPSLCNFVGEYLVLQGAAQAGFWRAGFAAAGVVLSACYMLWMYQRVFLGQPGKNTTGLADLQGREWVAVVPLLFLMVYLGIGATNLLLPIGATNKQILQYSATGVEMQVRNQGGAVPHAH